MVKPKPIIIVSGLLVLIGIAITAYQAQTTAENLSNQQQTLAVGGQMVVTKDMDPAQNEDGVYSLQVTDFTSSDNVKANVVDPAGSTIITKTITKSPMQESFKVSSPGTYKLQIENQGQREIQVLGIIGYYPKGIELIDVSGFIILVIGLSGLAIGMMFLIRNRTKLS